MLRCPDCQSNLACAEGAWTCSACGCTFDTDLHGIIHLSSDDYFYREVPRSFFNGMLTARTDDEVKEAFDRALWALPDSKRDYLVNCALDLNRGGAVVLVPVREGTVSLDFGSGWGNLTRTISNLGGTVFSVDMTYESLLFTKAFSSSDRVVCVKAGQQYPLPFGDGVFDFVFLNGVLEWIPEGYMMEENPRDVQVKFLREFHRVLKPGGRILIGIENRNSIYYWVGMEESHAQLRFVPLMPRSLADRYMTRAKGRPYRTYTYTRSGYLSLMMDGGFGKARLYIPWLRYRYWDNIIAEEDLRSSPIILFKKHEPARRKVAKVLARTLQWAGLLNPFVPCYLVAAAKGTSSDSPPDSVIELLLEREGNSFEGLPMLNVTHTNAINFRTGSLFYKVPLGPECARAIENGVKAWAAFREKGLGRYVVGYCAFAEAHGVKYGVYSAVDRANRGAPGTGKKSELPVIATFLRDLINNAEAVRLDETDFWRRISSSAFGDFIGRFLPGETVQHVLGWGMKQVPAGIIHGDFCWQNVIVQPNGECRVVDLDQFEALSPKFLDIVNFNAHYLRKQKGLSLTSAFKTMAGDTGGFLFGKELHEMAGDLSIPEMLLLFQLDRTSKDIQRAPGMTHQASLWYKTVAAGLDECARLVGLPTIGPAP